MGAALMLIPSIPYYRTRNNFPCIRFMNMKASTGLLLSFLSALSHLPPLSSLPLSFLAPRWPTALLAKASQRQLPQATVPRQR